MTSVALITNMPVPYRIKVLDRLASSENIELNVFYLTESEPDRCWSPDFKRTYVSVLNSRSIKIFGRNVHFSSACVPLLRKLNPDVVICSGYSPAYLWAMLYSIVHRKKLILHTDGGVQSEAKLRLTHKLLRLLLRRRIDAVICTSNETAEMHQRRGFSPNQIFISPLSIENERYGNKLKGLESRTTDLLFVGRFEEVKNPIFFLNVCRKVQLKLGRTLSVTLAGSGSLEHNLRKKAQSSAFESLVVDFRGFLSEGQLIDLYENSKVFIFPSKWEPWGLVANESLASCTPIVASNTPGSVGDLIKDHVNSFVIPDFDEEKWVSAIYELLTEAETWKKFSTNAKLSVAHFNYDQSAKGMIDAINYVS